MLGDRDQFYIKPGYTIRTEFKHFDDTPFKDEFQDCVYKYARGVSDFYHFNGACDIGCGSGFKLMKYFGDKRTLGLDVEPTVAFLKSILPHREWRTCEFTRDSIKNYDLAICSDVIEHLIEPDRLMEFIQLSGFRRAIISTPERDVLNNTFPAMNSRNGPPKNIHHIREWNTEEFKRYLSDYFQIVKHVVDGQTQFCEVVI